jgi:multicomponent K+:H+ antiporter subunit E
VKRLLPTPLLSATLLGVWLLLNNTVDPAHVVLGSLLAVVVPRWTAKGRPQAPRIGRPMVIVRLALVVLLDIVRSNIEVARRILGPEAAIRPRFVWVPLALTDPYAVLSLAAIVTLTPGTLSAELSPDRQHLLVHAFNVDDEQALIGAIKSRYESPLKEIFR